PRSTRTTGAPRTTCARSATKLRRAITGETPARRPASDGRRERAAMLEADALSTNVQARRTLPLGRVGFGIAALVAVVVLGRQVGGYVLGFAAWVQGLGVWGPVVFIAGYVLATVAFVPGALLTLAAGAIFGLVRG